MEAQGCAMKSMFTKRHCEEEKQQLSKKMGESMQSIACSTSIHLYLFQNEEKRSLELAGHVGFDSLPDQLVSKAVSQGFCFNILCVGKFGFH